MLIFRKSYSHPNKGEGTIGPGKGDSHVKLQESNSLKRLMHSASSSNMAATLQLENDLIVFTKLNSLHSNSTFATMLDY